MRNAQVMQIGEFAERTGMSHRTIRHYDQVGLLQPSGRSEGGYRLYTEGDVQEMLLIRRMKPLGYTLEEMARLLAVVRGARAGSGDGRPDELVLGFVADAQERRRRLAQHLDWADEFLGLLADLDAPSASDAAGRSGGTEGDASAAR